MQDQMKLKAQEKTVPRSEELLSRKVGRHPFLKALGQEGDCSSVVL